MIRVGTTSLGYNHQRNFISLPFQDIYFSKVHDFNKIISYTKYKLTGKVDYKMINRFNDWGLNNVHLYHFFNTLTPVKKPWLVTYETTLPRSEPYFTKGYEWMSSKFCKRIIAFSQRAYNAQMNLLSKQASYKEAISQKMVVLPPTQKVLTNGIFKKEIDEVVFTFAGSAFYRKGGWELIQAFERLKQFNPKIKLIVISKLEKGGYKDGHITNEMQRETESILTTNPLIQYHSYLPNERVLEILKFSDVGILPSWGETYGYFILEAMASGCSVIAPNVSPFPEFVSSEWGWLIDVNTRIMNGLEISNPTPENSEMMIKGIIKTVHDILNDPQTLLEKRRAALERISNTHNPYKAARFLEDIYRTSI